jgi:Mn-dependent DtxR family transcriptional regulator
VGKVRKTERLSQILDILKDRPAPRKRKLAHEMGISVGTLSSYLSILHEQGRISYLRSTVGLKGSGRTFVVIK